MAREIDVIIYDGISDHPTIVKERDNTRKMPRATQWQHPDRSSLIPVSNRPAAPTADQYKTLFKRMIGKTASAHGRVVRGFGRITSDAADNYNDSGWPASE